MFFLLFLSALTLALPQEPESNSRQTGERTRREATGESGREIDCTGRNGFAGTARAEPRGRDGVTRPVTRLIDNGLLWGAIL
jgi:hypothetical protein